MTRKLLLYSHSWAPSVGGVETVMMDLARGICHWSNSHPEDAWEVTLVTRTPADGTDDFAYPFRVVRQPSMLKLVRLFCETSVLHLAGPSLFPMAAGWMLAHKMVIEHHNYHSICPNGLLIFQPSLSICPGHYMSGRYRKCVECNAKQRGWIRSLRDLLLMFPRRWIAKRANVHVAPSRHMQFRAELPRTQLIYHGVSDSRRPIITKDLMMRQSPCFAFVGRLVQEKGVSVLLRAAEQLAHSGHDFRLIVIGDGPERHGLESMAEGLGISRRVEFTGSIPHAEVSKVLDQVAAVIMPSTWEDVAPLVALEQMSDGRLLIVSDVAGLGETVDGFGLKYPVGDHKGLASCMKRVIEDPSLAAIMGQKAHDHALEAFTLERMVEEHLKIYRTLVQT